MSIFNRVEGPSKNSEYPDQDLELRPERIRGAYQKDPERYAEETARHIERIEAYRAEWRRIEDWAVWPNPALRFLAPIGIEEVGPPEPRRRPELRNAPSLHLPAYIPKGERIGPEDLRG